jgi:hypothetical protein
MTWRITGQSLVNHWSVARFMVDRFCDQARSQ